MGSSVISSTGTVPDGPGFAQLSHIYYAANTGLWWAFYYSSTSATTLYAKYSSDLVTWNTPTNNTFTILHGNNGHGANLGVAYKNISSTDVVWFNLFAGGDTTDYVRATLSGTTITWGSLVQYDNNPGSASNVVAAPAVFLKSNYIAFVDGCTVKTGFSFYGSESTGTDTGSAAAATPYNGAQSSGFGAFTTQALLPHTGSDRLFVLADNGTPNNVTWEDVAYSSAGFSGTGAAVFATTVAMNANDWGCCLVSDTDVHCVRYEGSSTFKHRRWNGTSWSDGDAIGTHTYLAGGGIAMATDGTSVWMFIIDSATGNPIYSNKWTSGSGWGGWSAFETTSQTRNYLTASYSSTKSTIAVAWSAVNGSNYDFTVEGFSTAAASSSTPPLPLIVLQAVSRAATR